MSRKDSVISTPASLPTANFTFRSQRPSPNFSSYPAVNSYSASGSTDSASKFTDNNASSISPDSACNDPGTVYPFARESAMRSTLLPGLPAGLEAAASYSTKGLGGSLRQPRCNPHKHDPNNHLAGMRQFDDNHEMICVQWYYAAEKEYARTRYETVAEEKARLMRERSMW